VHLIVTRFAVPREDPKTAGLYRDPRWLEERLELFRRFFVPSVGPLGVPAVLLCGAAAAGFVSERVADLPWARVEVQDRWRGGWRGGPDRIVTRMDSDDALHRGWFEAVERAPAEAEVLITREFLRYDLERGRLHRYRRREPSPLAAFRGGLNPYRHDHKHLERHHRVHEIRGARLLQVVHGGNLSNRRPSWWRLDRRVPGARLAEFGLGEPAVSGAAEAGGG
jgi:hypothetical protein